MKPEFRKAKLSNKKHTNRNKTQSQVEKLVVLTWFEVEVVAVSVLLGPAAPVSYSPSNELWDDAEAVPVLDSRFNYIRFDGVNILVSDFVLMCMIVHSAHHKLLTDKRIKWKIQRKTNTAI